MLGMVGGVQDGEVADPTVSHGGATDFDRRSESVVRVFLAAGSFAVTFPAVVMWVRKAGTCCRAWWRPGPVCGRPTGGTSETCVIAGSPVIGNVAFNCGESHYLRV